MKTIIESSVYLIIMAIICLFSMDFVSMNMGITNVGQVEQYVEDYIELNGSCEDDKSLDAATVSAVNKVLADRGMSFKYEYMSSTDSHAYYKIQVEYSLRSALFHLGKTHTFDGVVRVGI